MSTFGCFVRFLQGDAWTAGEDRCDVLVNVHEFAASKNIPKLRHEAFLALYDLNLNRSSYDVEVEPSEFDECEIEHIYCKTQEGNILRRLVVAEFFTRLADMERLRYCGEKYLHDVMDFLRDSVGDL